jgi:hypothetical protein
MSDPWAQFPDATSSPKKDQGGGNDPFSDFPDANEKVYSGDQKGADTPKEKMTNLPEPSAGMFAQMDDQTAQLVHKAYENHPNASRDQDGHLLYNGKPVPDAEGNSAFVSGLTKVGDAATYPIAKGEEYLFKTLGIPNAEEIAKPAGGSVVGGVVNAIHNAGTGLAGLVTYNPIDHALEAMGLDKGYTDNKNKIMNDVLEGVDNTLPIYNPKGDSEHTISGIAEVGAGALAGNKAAAALKAERLAPEVLKTIAEKLPKLANYFGGVLSRTFASGAGVALSVDGKGDTMVVGPDAQFKLPKEYVPLLKGFDGKSESEAQKMFEDRMNVLLDNIVVALPVEIGADHAKAAGKFLWEGFIKPLVGAGNRALQEQMVTSGLVSDLARVTGAKTPEQVEYLRTKMSEILKTPEGRKLIYDIGEKGVSKVDVPLDTVTVLERALAGDKSEEGKALLEGLKKHRKQVISTGATQTEIAMDRPADALQKLTQETQDAFGGDSAIKQSAKDVQKLGQEDVGSAIAQGEGTGQQIDDLHKSLPGLVGSNDIGQSVLNSEGKTLTESVSAKNEVTQKIADTLRSGLEEVRKTGNAKWADIPEGLPIDTQSFEEKLLDAQQYLPPSFMKSLKGAVEFDDEGAIISGDLKKLQSLRGPLSKQIDKLRGQAGFSELTALRDNLTKEQPEWVLREGLPGSKKVQEAVDYYKNTRSPVESGAVGDVGDIAYQHRFDIPKRDVLTGERIENTLKSSQPAEVQHMVSVLSRPEFNNPGLVLDFAKADIADELRSAVKTSGAGEFDPKEILGKIRNYRQLFASQGLTKEAKAIDQLESGILQNKSDIKTLEGRLSLDRMNFDEVRDRVYNKVYKDFFNSDGYVKSAGFHSFDDMFKDPQNADRVKIIAQKARDSGNPVVLDGMKAAYGKSLDNFLSSGDVTATGAQKLNSAAVTKKAPEFLAVGDEIFKDNPKFMEAVRGLVDPALENQTSRRLSAAKTEPSGFSFREAKQSQTRLVNALVGPLTRIGARIGAISSAVLQKLDPDGAAKAIKDAFFADPDEAVRLLDQMKIHGLSDPHTVRDVFQWYVKSGLYSSQDYDNWKRDVDQMNAEDQTREMMSKEKK